MESQLVASEAAGPWVPVSEMRIWICSAIIGLFLGGLTFALASPNTFHTQVAPLTNHLLVGPRPVLVVGVQSFFLALSTQLGLLISWYRARCRLDFGGRHRVWPWAIGLLGIATFCIATNTHRPFGQVIHQSSFLPWRGTTVAWLLPFWVAALPIALWVDRDMRNSRSSLYTFRISIVLGVATAWLEIYQPELQSKSWYRLATLLIPLFASATLFVSLLLHARVVAYVCPDPPELDERSAWSLLKEASIWLGSRLMFWKWIRFSFEEDDGSKSKRRRKKAEPDETASKRKRKAPAKRTTSRTRTRVKPVDEEVEESNDASNDEESESVDDPVVSSPSRQNASWEDKQEQWDEEPNATTSKTSQTPKPKGNGRVTFVDEGHGSSVPAPHSRRSPLSWMDEPKVEQESAPDSNDSSEETDEDRQFQIDSGMTADQMKGMSKRQKRELRKQLRDQERARGR